jgi:hypothetical protein
MYTTEEFREQVYLWYDTNGITVGDPNEGNWEHAHIVPRCAGGTETVLLLHGHHIMHDLVQSREYNRMCFYAYHTKNWLYGEGFLCGNWFELVSLYEYYSTLDGSRRATVSNITYWAGRSPEQRSAEMSDKGKARWAAMTPEERSAQNSRVAKAGWAGMTPEERSAEMKRRMAVRRANQARAADTL